MDLWDVVRVMARRWYVSVPLLLLTAAALLWTGLTVSPNHTAEAHVMVLPPTTQASPEAGEEQVVNPWTTDSLAGALVTTLRNHNLAEQLADEGYRAEWEVGLDLQFQSVIQIEVTSPTKHEAQSAASRLLQVVGHEVDSRQAEFDLTDGEKISTVVLGEGDNTDVVRGNQVRALVVVFGACAIVTAGLTIGVDALIRRRHARGVARVAPAPEPALVSEAVPTSGAASHGTSNGSRAEPSRVGAAVGDYGSAGDYGPAVGDYPAEVTRQPGIKVNYRPPPPGARASASVPPAESDPRPAPEVDDSTVVLPLSGTDPRRQERRDEPADGHGAAKVYHS